jgi:hypothetical protein
MIWAEHFLPSSELPDVCLAGYGKLTEIVPALAAARAPRW